LQSSFLAQNENISRYLTFYRHLTKQLVLDHIIQHFLDLQAFFMIHLDIQLISQALMHEKDKTHNILIQQPFIAQILKAGIYHLIYEKIKTGAYFAYVAL